MSEQHDTVLLGIDGGGSSTRAVLTDGAKTAFAEFYSNKGTMPTSNASAGLATDTSISGKYVSKVAVATSVITATFGNEANTKIAGKFFILSPIVNSGSIAWSCTKSTVDPKYLPTSCRP